MAEKNIDGWSKEAMADEIIAMLGDGCSLNLGIGMPTLIAQRMPRAKGVFIQSEKRCAWSQGTADTRDDFAHAYQRRQGEHFRASGR